MYDLYLLLPTNTGNQQGEYGYLFYKTMDKMSLLPLSKVKRLDIKIDRLDWN